LEEAAMQLKERVAVDGIELEYTLRGSGEPIVLIHWGVSATWVKPLLDQPALAGNSLLAYHRAGFGGSSTIDGSVTMADHAEHCRLLMRELGIERAHVVGHSSSVAVALQLALDAPEVVPHARRDGRRAPVAADGSASCVQAGVRGARGRALPRRQPRGRG
jgi:pimeloyl-ACP methyl ester carboxylesterase